MVFSNFFQGLSDAFSVNRPVTSSSRFGADEDILKTTNALKGLGHINDHKPDIGAGLKSFQADQGLKVDGIMNPGGPTANALSQSLAQNGIGNSDLLVKKEDPIQPEIKVTKPISTQPHAQSFTASAPFGSPAKVKKPKIDPRTGRPDPLATSPFPKKSKAEMDKLWEQAGQLHPPKPKTAIVPQGNTVDERIRSIMADPRYSKKQEKPIVDHVVKQFERAYPGKTQYDENEDNNFDKYREKLAPREGGIADRPEHEDSGGVTKKGMSQEELNELRKTKRWKHLPTDVREMSDQEINDVFREEYFLRTNLDKIEKIPGLLEENPRFAELLFDANIHHGIDNPGQWLQEALLEEAGIDVRIKNPETGEIEFDGIIGPATRQAIKNAVQNGKLNDVYDSILEKRFAYMKKRDNYKFNKGGWNDRIEEFRRN